MTVGYGGWSLPGSFLVDLADVCGKWTLEGIETRAQLLDSDGLLVSRPILILWCAKRTSSVMIYR